MTTHEGHQGVASLHRWLRYAGVERRLTGSQHHLSPPQFSVAINIADSIDTVTGVGFMGPQRKPGNAAYYCFSYF